MKSTIILFLAAVCLVAGSQIDDLRCWTRRNKTHYTGLGLDKSLNINDTIECIRKCRETDFCHAVDIDTATVPNCWYQKKSTFVANVTELKPLATVTNYLYDPMCGKVTAGVDLSCWTVTTGHHMSKMKQVNITTLSDCLNECSGRKDCQVADWDMKTSPSCWVQTTPLEVSKDKLVKRESVTNFMLNRDCHQLKVSLDYDFWRISHLTKYAGPGLVQVDMNDLKSCLDFCKGNDLCTMVEFDPSQKPPCFAQTTAFEIKREKLEPSKTASSFQLNRAQYKKFLYCYQSSFP